MSPVHGNFTRPRIQCISWRGTWTTDTQHTNFRLRAHKLQTSRTQTSVPRYKYRILTSLHAASFMWQAQCQLARSASGSVEPGNVFPCNQLATKYKKRRWAFWYTHDVAFWYTYTKWHSGIHIQRGILVHIHNVAFWYTYTTWTKSFIKSLESSEISGGCLPGCCAV
jgi:hypothetical protein